MTNDLTTIRGVGETIAEGLRDAGFETVDDVLEADVDELAQVNRVGEATAKAILEGDAKGYNGRPSKLEKFRDELIDAAEEGLTYEGIARVAGVGLSTLQEWRKDHEEFNAELERARARGEVQLVRETRESRPEFILERSYGYTKEQEIALSGGEEIGGLSEDDKEMLDDLFDRKPQT